MSPSPMRNTLALTRVIPELVLNGQTQNVGDFLILSPGEYHKVAFHHVTGTWVNNSGGDIKKLLQERSNKYKILKKVIRNNKIEKFIRRYLPKKIYGIYVFVAYDMLDLGIKYFITRYVQKRDKSKC